MDILLVFGIVMLLLAAAVAVLGVRHGTVEIANDARAKETDAVVASMPRRLGIVLLNWIPLVAFEYAPVLRYRTETGEDVEGTLPWAVGISPEIRACRTSLETHTPLTVHYDPDTPASCWIRPRTAFRIREVIYYFVVAGILAALGIFVLWGRTLI